MFPLVQSFYTDIHWHHTPVTLQLITPFKRTLSSVGMHPSMSPTIWSIFSLFRVFVNVCTPPPFVTIVSVSASLSQPSSPSPAPHQSLFCSTISKSATVFSFSSSCLSPHFHLSALVFPRGNHLKWCFITTFNRPTFPTAASHPLS